MTQDSLQSTSLLDDPVSSENIIDSGAQPSSIPRRHDLDALRAIAMLLGIALHGVLSFVPLPDEAGWPVHDASQSDSYGMFMAAIHGFRMPLFFLISGFFTAMLWRKRGLRALINHRFKRILLPLVIGVFTIVPSVFLVSLVAISVAPMSGNSSTESEIWTVVRSSDIESLSKDFAPEQLDQWDPAYGTTPLTISASLGNLESVNALIDQGANVNARNRDGSTALHAAAFFGRTEVAQKLLNSGADPNYQDRLGLQAEDQLETSLGMLYIQGALATIEIDPNGMIEGRHEIATILPDAASVDIPSSDEFGSVILIGLMLFPIFYHLWFLSFLCWLVAGFAIYALLANRLQWKPANWLVVSPIRYAWLIPLTFVPQAMMGWLFPNYGPDTSVGLIPVPEILLYYAIFFFFGALYFDCEDPQGELGSRWWATLPVAILIFPFGYEMTMGELGFSASWIQDDWFRPLAVLLQVLYVWLMSFGLMGLFRRFFSAENRTMRYVSDSSYWLYLAHLPLIIVAQAIVRDWAIPSFVKFVLVCVVTSGLMLASYEYFVRYTFIGTLLNGKRTRPDKSISQTSVEPATANT